MRSASKGFWIAAIAAGLCSMTGTATAAEAWGTGTLLNVYPLSTGNFVITLATDPPGCPATASPKYLYVVAGENGVTADGVKAMLAAALTALATDKVVSVAFENSSVSCYVNRLSVSK